MDGHAHVAGMAGSEGRKITRTCCLATFAAAFSRDDSDAYSLALAMYPCATSWSWIAPAFSRSASACHRPSPASTLRRVRSCTHVTGRDKVEMCVRYR